MKQVYILEDDDGIREMLSFLLTRENLEICSFPTAAAFKKSMSLGQPDLILMDVRLPDGNGLEICKNLSDNTETKNIPVVLMSAHADLSISKESGARDFIAKPFDVDDFIMRIHKQLA